VQRTLDATVQTLQALLSELDREIDGAVRSSPA